MSRTPLIIELFTEELPPKALKKLGHSFSENIEQSLNSQNLLGSSSVTPAMPHHADWPYTYQTS